MYVLCIVYISAQVLYFGFDVLDSFIWFNWILSVIYNSIRDILILCKIFY